MRRFSSRGHGTVLAELNITPLLDLVFVLLIIFMITTPLLEQQLPVDLPKSSQAASSNLPDPKSIVPLTIHKDGTVLLGQEAVALNQLSGALHRRKAADPELVARDGSPFRLSSLHGRKVLLVAWSSY